MEIHGIQKMTLLDYPEKVACTIFTARTFLVDPTGIVIDKNLRGEKLEEALSKLFE